MFTENSGPGRNPSPPVVIARLVYADVVKLSSYWVILAGYAAMVGIAVLGAYLVYHAEQAIAITSGSGYAFAVSLVVRCVDFGAPIIYVMICILFALEVSNGTVKYILTRPVTRIELLISKYITAMLMVAAAMLIFWAIALLTGWIAYGLGDLTENEYVIFEASYMYKEIVKGTLYLLIPFAAIAAMALMVSTYSSTMGGAIIIGLILYFFFQILGLIPVSLGITAPPVIIAAFIILTGAAFIGVVLLIRLILGNKKLFQTEKNVMGFFPNLWLVRFLILLSVVAGVSFAYLIIITGDYIETMEIVRNSALGEPELFPYATLGFPSQRFVPMYILDDLPTGIRIDNWWSWDMKKMTMVSAAYFAVFFIASIIGVKKRDFVL